MHLTKLQILGFKSFADETTLEFGAGLTAVVGPNGSGKSNIVDAILWALGERSHKALRGHAATDVIFNGAANRKPTGLAEVSLFFDNAGGELPIGFQEVQVTRRLFRDGEGEYRLGGSRCRLRDVTDLFLDTGVGPDAGCIISQGEIDAILSARPEDRRGLIEGAAGIQKYHARRTETRRRLDRVGVDLTRICDIASELEKQVAPLAAQAQVAREYDALVARLKALQLAVLARDYAARQTRLADNQSARAQSEARVGQAQLEIENAERFETLTARRLRELETQVELLSEQLTETVSSLKGVEGQIAVARERRRALSEQGEFGAREIGHLRARIAATSEQIAQTKAALARAGTENSGLNAAAAQAEARLGAANAALSEAARELQLIQDQHIETLRAGQARREQIAAARAGGEALDARLRELEKLAHTGDATARELESARAEAVKTRDGLRAQIEDQTELHRARAALESARAGHKTAAETLAHNREHRARAASRAGALRELQESGEGLAGGTRAVLAAAQKGDLPPDYLPVAEALVAPRELELAIEIALGAAVNNLICPDNRAAKTAIEFLKRRSAGRATFLPLDVLRASGLGPKTLDILSDNAVRGIASELVEFDAKDARAIEYLLGRIVIVETLEDATRLARRCDGGARLVTLQGELVLPAGAVTGGAGKGRGNGLLGRKRELDEIEATLAELETQIETANADLNDAQDEVSARENALREATETHQELRRALARQEREAEGAEREARRHAAQIEAVAAQIAATRAKLDASQISQRETEIAANAHDANSKALESRVEGARAVVAQRQSEKDRIAAEVAEVRGQFSGAQERLSAMRREIRELERTINDANEQIVNKQSQLDRAQTEDARLISAEIELISALEEQTQRRSDLEYQTRKAREERGAALEKLEVVNLELKKARLELHEAQDQFHKIEVRIAATETEIADTRRRLRDEFALEAASVLACLETGAPLRLLAPASETGADPGDDLDAGSISDGAGAFSDGAGTISDGAGAFSASAGAFSDSPGTISDSAGGFSDSAGTISDGAGAFSDGAGAFSDSPGTISDSAGGFSDSAGTGTISGTISDGAGGFSDGGNVVSASRNGVSDVVGMALGAENGASGAACPALDHFLREAGFERRAATLEIAELTRKIGGLGSVNVGAVAQYEALKTRLDFLVEQRDDLEVSRGELNAIMAEIDGRIQSQFTQTFAAIRTAFGELFERVFGGGKTHLSLTDPDNLLETGIELRVQMPGKAAQDISLLSGGERALTALSFMMAILRVRPAPFVILDEVDAPLDQSNVGRFTDLLREFAGQTQFIVITHNNGTMQAADVLYGVTQQQAGVSTLMSVRLAESVEVEALAVA